MRGLQTLARGLDFVQQVVNNASINSPEIRLADEVSNQMATYEYNSKAILRATILGLYVHWFLSLIGLFESLSKCFLFSLMPLLYGFIWIALFIIYYIVLCFSCGRTDGIPVINTLMENTCKSITNSMSLFCLYIGLLIGMIGNLIIPWNAPFSFYKTQVILKRPPGSKAPIFQIECCNSMGNLHIPKHIICKKFLLIGGGYSSLFCSLLFEDYTRIIVSEYENEVETDTITFFQQTYNCPSFDQLLYSYSGGGQSYQPSSVAFSQQPQIHQAIAVPVNPNIQNGTYVQVAFQVPT